MWFAATLRLARISSRSLLALVAISATGAATAAVSVDTNEDGNDGECQLDCTLREAIAIAMPGEMVLVPEGTYPLTLGVLQVDKNLTITGAGPRVTEVVAANNAGAFRIDSGAVVTLTALTVRRDVSFQFGGGILNHGTLTLNDCVLSDNVGGASLGGGLENRGRATLNRCLVTGNLAEFGGGLFSDGELVVNNSTISGNETAFDGAGILSVGPTTLRNTTVTANNARLSGPGGIAGFGLKLQNSIVADQVNGADCSAGVDSSPGHNLDSDGSCMTQGGPGNLTGPAGVGPLQDNGGLTDTHAPLANSPAVDAGGSCLPIDQRGVTRPQGPACDIGAVELDSAPGCSAGVGSDPDGDGICGSADNCPELFNPDQGPVPFDQTLTAMSKDRISWASPADIAFVIGDLNAGAALVVLASGERMDAVDVEDPVDPSAGFGFFYLVKATGSCTTGSWQTVVGAEPERDAGLP